MCNEDDKPLKVALAGLGTVGSALYHLVKSGDYLETSFPEGLKFQMPLEIVAVYANDRSKPRSFSDHTGQTVNLELTDIPFVETADELFLQDPDVVVEVTGNVNFAKELAEKTFARNVHFVTANKALMAKYGLDLAELAEGNRCALRMEAAVAGGIPVLHTLYQKDGVKKIRAILNGTTNFILDKMTNGALYEDAFAEAGRLGWLEADPTFDVDGRDAAQKTLLLAALGFGNYTTEEKLDVTGITQIKPEHIESGKKQGRVYKLICEIDPAAQKLKVAPALVPDDSDFGKIKGGKNIVELEFEDGSKQVLTGFGAGGIPTAESVLLDLAYITTITNNADIIPVFKRSAHQIQRV